MFSSNYSENFPKDRNSHSDEANGKQPADPSPPPAPTPLGAVRGPASLAFLYPSPPLPSTLIFRQINFSHLASIYYLWNKPFMTSKVFYCTHKKKKTFLTYIRMNITNFASTFVIIFDTNVYLYTFLQAQIRAYVTR